MNNKEAALGSGDEVPRKVVSQHNINSVLRLPMLGCVFDQAEVKAGPTPPRGAPLAYHPLVGQSGSEADESPDKGHFWWMLVLLTVLPQYCNSLPPKRNEEGHHVPEVTQWASL